MKSSNVASRSRRTAASRFKKSLLVCALSLSFMGSAHAQTVVEIGPNLFQSIMNQINTLSTQIQAASEYATQATRWTRTLQQFQDMMTNFQNTISALGLPQGVDLKKVPDNFMVVERCGDGGGFSAILGQVTGFSMQDKIKETQIKTCTNIQRMQNKQYNEMVDYMTTTMAQMNSAKSSLDSLRGSSKTSGEMNGAIYKVEEVNGQMEKTRGEFEARMKAYDTYIAAQNQTQNTLSAVTMRGKPSLLGEVIKTATLKAALEL